MNTHTIIGAGGAIGSPLAAELIKQGQPVRLLSRSGAQMQGAESRKTDVFDLQSLTQSLEGSKVAYLTVGLEYKLSVWREKWPRLMQNVIEACAHHGTSLIFFDNVYMYGKVAGKMTEETPYNPCSKKGEIRARVANLLMEATQKGQLKASIARSADFYGPWADKQSGLYILALKNLAAGKKAQGLGDPTRLHSFTYTLDCAKALVLLANDPESFNQIWHMPTAHPPLSVLELVKIAEQEIGLPEKGISTIPEWMLTLLGIFMPVMKELVEMNYQNRFDYWFDSSKFETRYNFSPTSYQQGIHDTVEFFNLKK